MIASASIYSMFFCENVYILIIKLFSYLVKHFTTFYNALLYLLKTSENRRFFMFSEGIEVEHWLKTS